MLKRFFLALLFVLPGAAMAADPLTKAEVDQFINAAEKMQGLEDKYPDADIDFDIDRQRFDTGKCKRLQVCQHDAPIM